jgi:hypothetical protein
LTTLSLVLRRIHRQKVINQQRFVDMELHFGRDIVLDSGLLPDYANWLSVNPGSDISDCVRPELKAEHFFAVASILTPAIIEYQGCLFLQDCFDLPRYRSWVKQTNGNLTSVESVMNHRHVRNIARSLREAPFPLIHSMAELIKEDGYHLTAPAPG